jgi:DNA-binding NarL/FixJ family response regulator
MTTSTAAATCKLILTVDDHPLIRTALREVLRTMDHPVELLEASDPLEGLAALKQYPTLDLVLLDLNFSAHDGLAFIPRFRDAAPGAPLIVYTMHEDPPRLREALARGAVGIVPKTHSPQLLLSAVEMVMQGGVYLPPQLARHLAAPQSTAAPSQALSMSDHQRRILELLSQGLPNKTIARKLGLAPSTVKNRLTAVFERLGVANRTQAAMAARAMVNQAEHSPH